MLLTRSSQLPTGYPHEGMLFGYFPLTDTETKMGKDSKYNTSCRGVGVPLRDHTENLPRTHWNHYSDRSWILSPPKPVATSAGHSLWSGWVGFCNMGLHQESKDHFHWKSKVICPHNRNFGKVGRQGPCLYRHSPRRSSVGECCAPRTGRSDCTFSPGA